MQTLPIIKNRLTKLYCFVLSYNNCLPYKYLIVKSLTSGSRKILYLLRLLFPLNRLISRLFLILASSLNIFTSLLRGSNSFIFIPARFWLLMLHHFMVFYEVILTIRLVVEWYPSINLTEGGVFEQIIFNLSEPYLKASEEILPRGLSAIFAFLLVDQIKSFIKLLYRSLVLYGGGSKKKLWIETVDLVGLAVAGETILPSFG